MGLFTKSAQPAPAETGETDKLKLAEESKLAWKDFYGQAIWMLLDSDMNEARALSQIALAVKVADTALSAYEERFALK